MSGSSADPSTEQVRDTVAARLRAVGQRLTANRQSLLDALTTAARPLTIPEILDDRPGLAQSSVYRNLVVFEEAEVPRIVALAKDGVFKGLEVTAVATGTNSASPNYPPSAWMKRVGWPFPVMADSTSQAAANAYGLNAYPFFVLVDANGKVAGRGTGEVSTDDIKANVKALLAGTPLPLLSPGSSSSL